VKSFPFSRNANPGVFFIAISQFGMAFSFQCILGFMPFYITKISPYGPKETIVWIGLIMGASNLVASVTASFWGGIAARGRPKLLFELGMFVNGTLILLLGFTSNLHLLLLMRVLQGVLGGVSTVGYILISHLSPSERLHKDLSLFQSSITAGQLVGPPIGAYIASLLGYKAPFIAAFLIVSVFILFCHRNVPDIVVQKSEAASARGFPKGVLFAWTLILMATIHITFLPSILPKILEGFDVVGDQAVRTAGLIIMGYTGSAIVGNLLFSRLASKVGVRRVIAIASLCGSLFLLLLLLSRGVWSFTALRMVEIGSVAPLIPLTFALFARNVSGRAIGFMNSARFIGMAGGAFLATFLVAYSSLLVLYLLIALFTAVSTLAFLRTERSREL